MRHATPPPLTCTATSPATACHPAELLAAGRDEVSELRRRHRRRVPSPTLCPTAGAASGSCSTGGQRISARRLLVTTGLRDELPDIPGLRDRWARDVLHCPYCHGHEVRDRQLGVLGGTPGAVRYAQIVRQWTHDLVYFTPPDILTATERTQLVARAIGVVEGTIEQLVIDDDDQLRGVQMRDGCVIPRDALFVPPRFVPNNTPARRPRLRRSTPTAGSPSTPPDAPASPESGRPGTSSTRAPRSSPPPAPAPRPPSRSTPTWSKTTSATQLAISTDPSCLNQLLMQRSHRDIPSPGSGADVPAAGIRESGTTHPIKARSIVMRTPQSHTALENPPTRSTLEDLRTAGQTRSSMDQPHVLHHLHRLLPPLPARRNR